MAVERPRVEQAAEQVCAGLGYQIQRGSNSYALTTLFLGFTNHAGRPDNIQVQMNFLMRVCALPTARLRATQFVEEEQCTFSLLAVEELFAGKLKALIERNHPWDSYDLFRFVKLGPKHDAEILRKLTVLFGSTLNRDLREYCLERFEAKDEREIERLLYPLLKADARPSWVEMFQSIRPLLQSVLDHSQEKAYLDAMAAGHYRPHLLFPSHSDILVRVRNHPALIWKARNVAEYLVRKHTAT